MNTAEFESRAASLSTEARSASAAAGAGGRTARTGAIRRTSRASFPARSRAAVVIRPLHGAAGECSEQRYPQKPLPKHPGNLHQQSRTRPGGA
jgi:hypothetical protein